MEKMTIAGKKFLQLHVLTTHLPSNLNRDNLGRPKTAQYGNTTRGRISSQSIKYAWRNSSIFQSGFEGKLSIRTRKMWEYVFQALHYGLRLERVLKPGFTLPTEKKGVDEDAAMAWSLLLRGDKEKKEEDAAPVDAVSAGNDIQQEKVKGKGKKKSGEVKKLTIKDLPEKTVAAFTPAEIKRLGDTIDKIVQGKTEPSPENNEKFAPWRPSNSNGKDTSSVDIALFGRMLASTPELNCDGAVQLSHLITVNPAPVEDDYFSAVDELNKAEDTGFAYGSIAQFLSGLYYCHVVVDLHQLVMNLGDDNALSKEAIQALVKSIALVSPRGKQHPMSSEGSAVYLRAEIGNQCPRHLGLAFLKPIRSEDLLSKTVSRMRETVDNINRAFGLTYDDCREMYLEDSDSSTITDIVNFASASVGVQ